MNSKQNTTTTVILFAFLCTVPALGKGQQAGNIKLNQLGFYPGAEKIAIVTGTVSSQHFYILVLPSNDTVYKAELEDSVRSSWSSPITRIARFSILKKPGTL